MSTAEPSGVVVTLEIFSGRENPSWQLEGDTLEAVRGRLRELATGAGGAAAAPHPVLGYRGFRIDGLGDAAADTILVGRGTVTLVRGKEAQHRRDAGDLESLLLADAARRGHGDLLREAGAPAPPIGA